MRLDAIADQPRAVEQLRRALASGRIAHAYAFIGPAGSGRFTTALAFAGELLTDATPQAKAATRDAETLRRHPDLHVVAPTPPESNPKGARAIRMGAIRELQRRASLSPALARRRVLIVDEAERMTDDAPQAFLKFLEEPPPETVIVLILPRARAMPATVVSRCQIVRFRVRGDSTLAAAAAEAVAWLDETRTQGVAALFKRTERVDRERAEALIDGCWLHCRDVLLARAGAPAALLTEPDRAEALVREATHWTDAGLYAAVEACRAARLALVNNVTPRLTVDTLLARVARRTA